MMKKTLIILFLTATLSGCASNVKWQGQEGWGSDSQYLDLYNDEQIETNLVEILEVSLLRVPGTNEKAVVIKVKTYDKAFTVHLGPKWYIEKQELILKKGDMISVKGSIFGFNSDESIMASEVSKGLKKLKLRDDEGSPLWDGVRIIEMQPKDDEKKEK